MLTVTIVVKFNSFLREQGLFIIFYTLNDNLFAKIIFYILGKACIQAEWPISARAHPGF